MPSSTALLIPMGDRRKRRRAGAVAAGLMAAAGWLGTSFSLGQQPASGRYYPFNHNLPPGVAGGMAAANHRDVNCFMQPIRVELPGEGGAVSFYGSAHGAATEIAAPADAAVQVGPVYRMRLSQMPDFPGVELYPTVELLDRLHPPRGREAEFPVPISFTAEEIRLSVEGRMITKVIYLEQPDRAAPRSGANSSRVRVADARENILAAADEAGRPIAIVRLGSRAPDRTAPEPGFYGMGAPIQLLQPQPARAQERQP